MGPTALIPKESLWALIPLVVYVIVAFKPKVHALTSAFLACVAGYILTGQTPALTSKLVQKSLGSTLGLIGLIIMCGAGLGAVMTEAHVTHTMVHWIVQYIGVKTEKELSSVSSSPRLWFVVCWALWPAAVPSWLQS